ncbi:MAG TPA: hypothetical protein VK742_06915 [Candidatus Sulfotelmatobacter sp.]|nr:hypothetical protein [Candidatus Sulfotelmatobacter sp.]
MKSSPSRLACSGAMLGEIFIRFIRPHICGIDAFEAMMMREDCEKGFFVSFDYSSAALQEIESFFKRSHKVIVALTVQEILDEHIAKKLV